MTAGRQTTALKGLKRVAGGWSAALPPERRAPIASRTPGGVPDDWETTFVGGHRTAFREVALSRRTRLSICSYSPTRHITALWNPDRGSGRLWDRVPGVPRSRNPWPPSGTPSGTTCRDRGGLYRHAKPCRTWGSCRGCRLSDSDRSGHFRPLSPDVEECGTRGGSSGKGDNDDDLPAVGAANPPDL